MYFSLYVYYVESYVCRVGLYTELFSNIISTLFLYILLHLKCSLLLFELFINAHLSHPCGIISFSSFAIFAFDRSPVIMVRCMTDRHNILPHSICLPLGGVSICEAGWLVLVSEIEGASCFPW